LIFNNKAVTDHIRKCCRCCGNYSRIRFHSMVWMVFRWHGWLSNMEP